MRSYVLESCLDLDELITSKGQICHNTVELVGSSISISVDALDIEEERAMVRKYYGDRYDKRAEDERYHYLSLMFSLLHKVKETRFFHSQGAEGRKIIVFSNDCISSAQYMIRGDSSFLIVYMRSSDVRELLPIDLLNLCIIHQRLDKDYNSNPRSQELIVYIGSAHYYLTGGRQ